jgi:hypothetical protein
MTVSAACSNVKRSVSQALAATWIDHDTGAFSVPHFASVVAVFALTAAFIKNAWMKNVDGMDYLYYALAMAASASPSLMYKLIALKFNVPTEEKK